MPLTESVEKSYEFLELFVRELELFPQAEAIFLAGYTLGQFKLYKFILPPEREFSVLGRKVFVKSKVERPEVYKKLPGII